MRASRLAVTAAAAAALLVLPGCAVHLGSVNGAQQNIAGPLELDVEVCGANDAATECEAKDNSGVVQLLVGLLVPEGTGAPEEFPLHVTSPVDESPVVMRRSASYTAALPAEEAPGAGQTWVGYIGTPPPVAGEITAGQLKPLLTPGPGTAPLAVAVVAGFRISDASPGFESDRPVVCGTPFDVGGGGGGAAEPEAACIATRSPETGTTDFIVNRLRLTAPAPAPAVTAGQEATLTYALESSDARTPDLALALDASTTVPGATAIAPTGVVLGDSGAQPVRVRVPAGTAPGQYDVTLRVRGLGDTIAQETATLTVAAPAPPATPTPTPAPAAPVDPIAAGTTATAAALGAPGARKALRRGKLRVAFTAPSAGKLRVVARTRGGAAVVIASGERTFARAGTKTITLRLTAAGRALLAKPGRVRLVVSTTFRAGGKTTKATGNVSLR